MDGIIAALGSLDGMEVLTAMCASFIFGLLLG